MTRKTEIINLVTDELQRINNLIDNRVGLPNSPYKYKTKVNQVFPRFKTFDEINDFPSIFLVPGVETRTHIGGGIRYGELSLTIRGYVYSENVIDAEDDLLDDIEFIINSISFLSNKCSAEIEESRIISVGSDEGLLEPIGVCEIECLIIYQLDETI